MQPTVIYYRYYHKHIMVDSYQQKLSIIEDEEKKKDMFKRKKPLGFLKPVYITNKTMETTTTTKITLTKSLTYC